jgi:hypothetical protein
MTDQEQFHAVTNALLTIRRENLRTLARLKAVEMMASELLPAEKRAGWYDSIDRLSEKILQELFESFEEKSPSFAATLDDRSEDELKGVE